MLVVPIFFAVRRCPRLFVVVVVCAAAPQWIVARVVGDRYGGREGEGDWDIAFLATAAAIAMTVTFTVAATAGWSMRPRNDRA